MSNSEKWLKVKKIFKKLKFFENFEKVIENSKAILAITLRVTLTYSDLLPNNSNSSLRISFSKRGGDEERSEKFHFAIFKIYFSLFGSGDFDDLSKLLSRVFIVSFHERNMHARVSATPHAHRARHPAVRVA
jgi:hypothetical protein